MPSASEAAKKRSTSGPPTLTGSDVTSGTITVTLTKVEESPEPWTAPLRAEFKPPVKSADKSRGQISVIGLNQTNIKALCQKYGDDYYKWQWKKVTFARLQVKNPQSKRMTWGLRVIA